MPPKKKHKKNPPKPLGDDTDDEEDSAKPQPPSNPLSVLNYDDYGHETRDEWPKNLLNGIPIPDEAYTNPLQKKVNNWHFSKKAAGIIGTLKKVPPMHPDWESDEFYQDMPLVDFVDKIVNNETLLNIMTWEIDFEVALKWKVINGEIPETANFQRKMQWASWSAMLQLEQTYPKLMKSCQGFPQCFEMTWHEYVNKAFSDNATYDTETNYMLTLLNELVKGTWINSGVDEPSAVRTFVTTRILNKLRNGSTFKKRWAAGEIQKAKSELGRNGPLSMPPEVIGALRKEGRERLDKHLTAPQTIHESEITEGVRKLVREIWGPDMDTSKKVNLDLPDGVKKLTGLTDKAKAACCLIELMCGSRLLGILFVNWFMKLQGATMEEWEKDKTKQYGAYERCIKVMRLSKEGTRAARAEKAQTSTDDIVDRVIVKPLNTHFVNRAFLDPEKFAVKKEGIISKEYVTDKQAVEIFLDLIRALREYMFQPIRAPARGAIYKSEMKMRGLIDEQVEKLPTKLRNYLNSLDNAINVYAKSKFTFFREGQGTHLFRKIYVNWAYNAFAKASMKEVGFASEVLGHRGYKVSLNYLSLIIKPSFAGELKDEASTREALSVMTDRMDEEQKTIEHILEVQKSLGNRIKTLEEEKGNKPKKEEILALIDKLPKAIQGTSVEEHVERGWGKVLELREHGLKPTWILLRSLGVNTSEEVRKKLSKKIKEE